MEKVREGPALFSEKFYNIILTVLALSMVAIHMLYSQVVFMDSVVYLTCHMAFSFAIMFVMTAKKSKSKIHTVILLIAVILCALFTVYIAINLDSLRVRTWSSTKLDLLVGMTMIILAFYATWLGYGAFIPVLIILVVIYPFFGKNLPEPFKTTAYSLPRTISNNSIGLNTGLYDATLTISANYVFLFSVFGGLLAATGVQKFFYEFGKLTVGRFRSGTAQITGINTALVGMVVGSAVANVSITGPHCIEGMKEAGYKPEKAAAIVAVGANGGQIMPPVMGIIAFAMAGYSGISYWTICKMAIIPALLYYGSLALYSHLHALKDPVLRVKKNEKPDIDWDIIKYRGPAFIVPFIIIITLLAKNYSVMTCAFWAIIAVVIMSFLVPKRFRTSIQDLIQGFVDGAISGVQVGCVCAVIGMLVATFTSSGLGVKLTSGIEEWSHGILIIALLILYFTSIVAGMAGVSVAAYFTAAAFAVPALQTMGVPYEIAHFFIVYPASFSTITPPVALASLVASRIADTKYGTTAIESCKVAAVGFMTPFLFVYAPALLMMQSASDIWTYIDIGIVVMLTVSLSIFWVGYFITEVSNLERILYLVSTISICMFLGMRLPILLALALAAFAVPTVLQIKKRKHPGRVAVS